jgi:hypothetical protein
MEVEMAGLPKKSKGITLYGYTSPGYPSEVANSSKLLPVFKDNRPYRFTVKCGGCGLETEMNTDDPTNKGWEVIDDTPAGGGTRYWLCPSCQCI